MITIATRGSQLALWQTRFVEAALAGLGSVDTSLEIIRTTGDRITDVPLASIGDRGLFTRELDNALLEGRADCAVHSLKDVPTQLPDGLVIAAVLEREDPRDAWVARDGSTMLDAIRTGGVIGTSSLRRRALLAAARPDLKVADVRGNLDTRLEKLQRGEYDALVLAHAGLRRLGRDDAVTALLDDHDWIPAPGQGAIAVVARHGAAGVDTIAQLNHRDTAAAVGAERSLMRALEGGCQVPIGARAFIDGDTLSLHALVASTDGKRVLRAAKSGRTIDADAIGRDLAKNMIADGASLILADARAQPPHSVFLP